ncbi:S8 family peptidase [Mycolicibacterium fortuitum]|uniref:S8 family peptidase n=1 Tax=Mycolicibacterium fortuitum TaxID=1766 RepID=UPI0026270025|nr:S8 family peptidase [Mycolicibacterium fortuitum]
MTLHPRFLSKTGFPAGLLDTGAFRHLGSRPGYVVPDQQARYIDNTEEVEYFHSGESKATTVVYVATTRQHLRSWSQHVTSTDQPLVAYEDQLVRLERLALNTAAQRDRLAEGTTAAEIVLHCADDDIIDGLLAFCDALDVELLMPRRFDAGSLVFIPARGDYPALQQITRYSFTRVVRAVPPMSRLLITPPEAVRVVDREKVALPTGGPADADLRVAVFDGGLPDTSVLSPWVTSYPARGAEPVDELVDHGHKVTSALLFGSVDPDEPLEQPYAHVDHYQVLDARSADDDPFELYSVINRIESILTQRRYAFVSISIGPDLPIEDDEVHAWTAFWDSHLCDGDTLLTIAIGNNGRLDAASGNARVQVPSDSVNALAIGAADSAGPTWKRASYSALGPGRPPGRIKPDVVAFGGCTPEPFICIGPDSTLEATCGTSFASPLALRTALAVRTLFGDLVSPLALKALLVHTADPAHARSEVGHGRIAPLLGDIAVCGDGEARVLYQGELTAKKYIRAQIPVPADLPKSAIARISATIAYSTEVDPADPGNYTRSGLDITFRPHRGRFKEGATQPKPDPFFKQHERQTEQELRHDAHKWDTVMHHSKSKNTSSLNNPVFDIHFLARSAGKDLVTQPKIRYAMVITVSCAKVTDMYDRVLRTYATQLQALQPVTTIAITT